MFDFDWFADRLDLAKWDSQTVGNDLAIGWRFDTLGAVLEGETAAL